MRNYLQQYVPDLLCVLACISLVASWFLLKRLPGWILSIRGANWPPSEGRIEITNVTAFGEQALAELG
ncbi:MAG TPA: hypothetical protein VFE61_24230 [Candidatus Sulfotelmatobacter sp.]|jgi:hypothetical protein|nr:hypothetical protein [Candidatus Sulfotelmatobacter sp.]